MHFWYGAVMRWFPGSSVSAVVKRVALDQFVCAPLVIPTFLTGLWIMEGKEMEEIWPSLQEQVPSTTVANWALWIPAQLINFRFVSGKYQVLFSNMVGFIWNVYLSYTVADATNQKRLLGER